MCRHVPSPPIILRQLTAWDASTGLAEFSLPGHNSWVNVVAIAPNNEVMASLAGDRELILWKLQKKEVRRSVSP